MVLFLTISDTDRSMDELVNLFYNRGIMDSVHDASIHAAFHIKEYPTLHNPVFHRVYPGWWW